MTGTTVREYRADDLRVWETIGYVRGLLCSARQFRSTPMADECVLAAIVALDDLRSGAAPAPSARMVPGSEMCETDSELRRRAEGYGAGPECGSVQP